MSQEADSKLMNSGPKDNIGVLWQPLWDKLHEDCKNQQCNWLIFFGRSCYLDKNFQMLYDSLFPIWILMALM